jgi:hypothetical protein
MENIFRNNSWKIESDTLSQKKLELSDTQKNFFINKTQITYLNNIFFDESVRIDIKLNGYMTVMINDTPYKLLTKDMENQCLLINNWSIQCDSNIINIPKDTNSSLKLIIEPNTVIDKFTIVQDLLINNCNPNN